MNKQGLVLLSASLLFACGQPELSEDFGSLAGAIVNASEPAAADDSAVFVFAEGPELRCTGTLIAPNLVATALHCVTHTSLGFFACNSDGSLSDSSAGQGNLGPLVDPADVSIHVGEQVAGTPIAAQGERLFGTGSTLICRGDIAFVVLDRAIDAPVTPVRLDYGVRAGETVRAIGYGLTEDPTASALTRRARSGVRIIDVGPTSEAQQSISASPRTFVVDEGPCHGDSGGPAISEDTGALVGVYSLTAGESCTGVGTRNVYTSLFSFSGLALDAFEAAGAEPVLDEPPVEPEKPPIVPDGGCALAPNSRHASSSDILLTLISFAAILRRRSSST